MKNNKWIGAGRFDNVRSTFMHRIYLDNGKNYMQGYTKGLFSLTHPDKIIELEKAISRLVKNGYIFGSTKGYGHRTIKFEVYLYGNYNGVPDELILTLYPTEYVFEKNMEFTNDVRLNQFLSRLYTQAKEGIFDPSKLIHKKVNTNQNDWNKLRFKTEPDLYTFMQTKIKEGHPVGLVTDFYLKYREKHLVNCI